MSLTTQISELKKQLGLPDAFGALLAENEELKAEIEELKTFKNAIMEEMGDEDMTLDDISTAVMDMNKDRIDAEEENEELKKQLAFEKKQGTITVHQNQALVEQSHKTRECHATYTRWAKEQIEKHKECYAAQARETDIEHVRYLDEQVKLGALKEDMEKLKAEKDKVQKLFDAYNEYICEGMGWDWFIYEISDEDKQMFLDAGMDPDNFDSEEEDEEEEVKDVKVGEGDVGWEKY